MPGREFRYIFLVALLATSAALHGLITPVRATAAARWPAAPELFVVDGWRGDPQHVDTANGATFITRSYVDAAGHHATLTIITSENVKLFEAGAEVPFLGSGYQVTPAPNAATPLVPGSDALLATRGTEQWLLIHAYGEQRGILGRGPVAWGMAVFDSVLGRPNDYYKLFVMTPIDSSDGSSTRAAVDLASALFPRIVAWYAAS